MSMMMRMAASTAEAAEAGWPARAGRIADTIALDAARHDAEDTFVVEGFHLLKEEGFFKALVPMELGGRGVGYGDICRSIRLLGASCGATALAFSMHSHLVAVAAWRWRHQGAPTDGLLRRTAAEDLVLVSSGGSDWLPSGGEAIRTEGGFLVSARKPFSSGCPAGDLLLTSAIYDDPDDGPTVLHFAVPLEAEGVERLGSWYALGMRGTGSHDIVLKNVFVPDASISGRRPPGRWHMLFHTIAMIAFPLIYSAYVGVAEGARAFALDSARKRPLDDHLADLVGEMENELSAADMALERMIRIAEAAEPGLDITSQTMIGRTLVASAAIGTVEKAMEIVGGASFYRGKPLERAWRDVQGARFHPLQRRPQLRYTGRAALGWSVDGA